MEKKELMEALDGLKAELKTATDAEMKKQIEAKAAEIEAKLEKMKEIDELKNEVKVLKDNADKNQQVIDKFVADGGKKKLTEKKTFGDVFTEEIGNAFESKQAEFEAFRKDRNAKLIIELKTVGNMLLSSNLSGDGVASYNQRQGLVPSQKVNFRDLIPVTQSPTGLYVTYRETGTEGSISAQTEGSGKTQIDYDLTEVKVVSDYIAGYARFSKQMMYQLPFLQGTLQRMLLRDFYKAENAAFFTAVSGGATGSTTMSATVDAEQLIELIANQMNANFNASYILVNPSEWARLLATKPSDYSIPGGTVIDPNGNIRIAGVPVIAVPWVTDDKALIIDNEYIERVETESLRVEFSYEDADNFTKNLVTARVECFEDINLLRTDAHIYADLGNAS
jgi:HK97 family phage major capsid protein